VPASSRSFRRACDVSGRPELLRVPGRPLRARAEGVEMEKGGVALRLHSAMRESRERAWKRREMSGKSGAPQKARERKVEEAKGKRRSASSAFPRLHPSSVSDYGETCRHPGAAYEFLIYISSDSTFPDVIARCNRACCETRRGTRSAQI